jgi:capsid portal protein
MEDMVVRLEKAHEIVVAGMSGDTRQDVRKPTSDQISQYIEPPVPLESLAALSKVSAVRSAIIDAIARNTVGLGYELDVAEGLERELNDISGKAQEAQDYIEGIAARDVVLDHPTFSDLLYAVKTDEEETGNGYIEVSRNKTSGLIDGLFHLPAKRMRRKRDRSGWALVKTDDFNAPEAEFYNFGEKVKYDSDGKPTSSLAPDKIWFRNEVITFRLYTSESRDYGLPRDVGLAMEYAGDKLAAEYNVSFFDSGGTPPTVLFVMGEPANDERGQVTFRVPQRTVERIASTIKSDGSHRDRVAIIPLPPGAKTEMHQLGQVSDKDMGFVQFRSDNIARALSAFRLSPIFIAIDTNGRYDAEVMRSVTLEQVFDPEQHRYEERLTRQLLNDCGFSELRIKFRRLAVEDNKSRRDSATRLGESGLITRREYRTAHGMGPIPEATPGQAPGPGQVPHGWNDELVTPPAAQTPSDRNNRTLSEQDQRGQRPGLAGRQQESTDAELQAQKDRQNQLSVVN